SSSLSVFMGTRPASPTSMAVEEKKVAVDGSANGHAAAAAVTVSSTFFVSDTLLYRQTAAGSWLHCGYHLTTSIVAPALLSLPFAFASLGWAPGVLCLVIGAAVTFYSYNLLSLVLEHHAKLGRRQLRFRDMAHDILGKYICSYFFPSMNTSLRHSYYYGFLFECIEGG
ncbi:hypothetical protein BHM03_00012087, partial [Ensete ventricosum]